MLIFWSYVIFLIVVVFFDYRLFAGSGDANGIKKAWHSILYWLVITLFTIGLIMIAYEKDWFQSYLSHDQSLSGWEAGSLFLSGYLVEQSLSLDNIFVMAFLLNYFKVPLLFRPGLLSIGIWTAILLRGVMIVIGLWLIQSISWLIYLLGFILIYSGIKIYYTSPEDQSDPNKSLLIKLIRRYLPVTKGYFGQRFIVRKMGKWALTPLLLTLVAIELTDILFALDSIPAIFAITTDPFLVLSSNILAIANMRSFFTILSRALEKLEFIHHALAILLIYIGIKILLENYVHISGSLNLLIILIVLLTGVVYSILRSSKAKSIKSVN
ncbi:MAG: TerC/Alx family metal homeostasis membrane protein [Saprospiraceae bacterium]|nr:TerC/Alx family metal homeostasis membrane protein [Candidatus Vicinibacter affinis]MBP6173060.1 TerC/Alx family metal homeostasis membrane protein [Saprospiraceae bacterium]MBK6571004.1 TerC/Alx family metal homeostasis membrane protein [Candidatus Vicinibacter affinis]MBK7303719.1 TerC/Alx family metal homeostasis membrane protein [Candidatus Vicinibacter affinis]MBK7695005.1 TerC/Alx family metal homeostasis membrane protein [Candidatus Vicinibacter affinis]